MPLSCQSSRGWLIMAAVLLLFLVSGCSDEDNPTKPAPPKLSLAVSCTEGLMSLTVNNTGGAMSEPCCLVAEFADGHADSLTLSLSGHETMTCQVSNAHGNAMVSNEEYALEAACSSCISDELEAYLSSIDLASMIPSPVAQQAWLYCTYSIYLENLTVNQTNVELIPREGGLTLRCEYGNITAGIAGTAPEFMCTDFTGSVTIASIVMTTNIDIVEGENPQVTIGTSSTTVTGLDVDIDGTFGFVVEIITDLFEGTLIDALEVSVLSALNNLTGSDLSTLVTANSGCAN